MAENSMPVNNVHPCEVAASIQECTRELQVRQRCYAKWVREGKLTQYAATEQYNRLAAAIQHLEVYEKQLVAGAGNVLDMPTAAEA